MNRPNSNLFIATKAKIRGRQDCLTITVNKQNGQLKHATLQMSKNDCENATNINLGATNKLLQVGKFTNTAPAFSGGSQVLLHVAVLAVAFGYSPQMPLKWFPCSSACPCDKYGTKHIFSRLENQ
jgi:hypothetical protein